MRFAKSGLDGFLPHEIVELLLTFCIPRRDVKQQAHALIDRFGSVAAIMDADGDSIGQIAGLGARAAQFFSLIRAVANAYLEQKSIWLAANQEVKIEDWAKFWIMRLGGEASEHREIAFLDGKCRPQLGAVERLSSGSCEYVPAMPREILTAALRRKCFAVILCHNHPGGSQLPSEHDERFTRVVSLHLKSIGIRLVDHIVVAAGRAFSIAEQRELNFGEIAAGGRRVKSQKTCKVEGEKRK
jgi:DNA repair protein RadC